jgi:hypothetical protein
MGCLRAFCGPWAQDEGCRLGFVVILLALAGPILLAVGGGILALHGPHLLVRSEAALLGVQNDNFHVHLVLPETYSWCVYALEAECDGATVTVTARRDDLAYNALPGDYVAPERCFADAEILNEPGAHGAWDAGCVDAEGVVCSAPRPVVRAWYKRGRCASTEPYNWTLNDPATTMVRVRVIMGVGAAATALGYSDIRIFGLLHFRIRTIVLPLSYLFFDFVLNIVNDRRGTAQRIHP